MSADKDVLVLGLKKFHVIIGALVAIASPSVVVTASFYKARSELEEKINNIQLQNVNTFARSDDMRIVMQALNAIQSDVAEIKGELKVSHRSKHYRSEE